jgi:hypothetical protein
VMSVTPRVPQAKVTRAITTAISKRFLRIFDLVIIVKAPSERNIFANLSLGGSSIHPMVIEKWQFSTFLG